MIYLSPDYESDGSGEVWEGMMEGSGKAGKRDVVLQYPYQIGPGDVSLVDARLGAEYVPEKVSGGLVVAVVLHDLHLQRRERERLGKRNAADLNAEIHRTNGCCVTADRVATVDGRMAGEIGRVVGEELAGEEGGVGGPIIEVVSDWLEYLNGLRALAREEMESAIQP